MNWPTATLGDIATIVSGATPRTNEPRFWGGDILWTTPKDLGGLETPYLERPSRAITKEGLASCAASLLPVNSVLLSSRAPIGLVAINSVPMATNQGFKSLVPNENKVDSKFLYHWLRTRTEFLQNLGNGATFKEISKAVVERIEISLPTLEEQRRIAAILDKVDALRSKRIGMLQLFESLIGSLFHEMFDEEESLVSVSDVCLRVTDGTHQAPLWADSGVPFLFVSNVRNQRISFVTSKFVSFDEYRQLTKNTPIEVGDVLYTAVGSYGNAAVVYNSEPFVFQRHIAHLKPQRSRIVPSFLSFALEAPIARRQADQVARGVAQKTVTLDSLKKIKIPLPPLEAQRRFDQIVQSTDAKMQSVRRSLVLHEQLRTSLQQYAFSGRL